MAFTARQSMALRKSRRFLTHFVLTSLSQMPRLRVSLQGVKPLQLFLCRSAQAHLRRRLRQRIPATAVAVIVGRRWPVRSRVARGESGHGNRTKETVPRGVGGWVRRSDRRAPHCTCDPANRFGPRNRVGPVFGAAGGPGAAPAPRLQCAEASCIGRRAEAGPAVPPSRHSPRRAPPSRQSQGHAAAGRNGSPRALQRAGPVPRHTR